MSFDSLSISGGEGVERPNEESSPTAAVQPGADPKAASDNNQLSNSEAGGSSVQRIVRRIRDYLHSLVEVGITW